MLHRPLPKGITETKTILYYHDTGNTTKSLEDKKNDIWHDEQQNHKPFQLTVDYQTIGHREKGRQHQVMYTSQTVVDAMLSDLK